MPQERISTYRRTKKAVNREAISQHFDKHTGDTSELHRMPQPSPRQTPQGGRPSFVNKAHLQATFDTGLGDNHEIKERNTFRLAFNNINGLSLTKHSLQDFTTVTHDLKLDWIGIAETHLDSTKNHVRSTFKNAMRSSQGFPSVNCVFAASDINYGTDRKRGGVMQMAMNNMATRVIAHHSDPYGRFTSQTHTGKNDSLLTTITGYQVCESSQGPASAYAQQRAMLVSHHRPAHPREAFIDDLTTHIQECQHNGHDILLCLDANDTTLKKNSGLRRLITTCSLLDVHKALHPQQMIPSHRRGSAKIDFILASPRVLQCITRAGILPVDEAYGSDHRLMFVDIDIVKCFHGITSDPISPRTRSFTTKNKKRADLFRKATQEEWDRRQLTKRIKILSDIASREDRLICPHKTQRLWDKIDREIGYALESSEQILQTPTRKLVADTCERWCREEILEN